MDGDNKAEKSPIIGWSGPLTPPPVERLSIVPKTLKEETEEKGMQTARDQMGVPVDVNSKLPEKWRDNFLKEAQELAASNGRRVEFLYVPTKEQVHKQPDPQTDVGRFYASINYTNPSNEYLGKWYKVTFKDGTVTAADVMSP
jgi:hypothetical protein